jgi:hypothetical protein
MEIAIAVQALAPISPRFSETLVPWHAELDLVHNGAQPPKSGDFSSSAARILLKGRISAMQEASRC